MFLVGGLWLWGPVVLVGCGLLLLLGPEVPGVVAAAAAGLRAYLADDDGTDDREVTGGSAARTGERVAARAA